MLFILLRSLSWEAIYAPFLSFTVTSWPLMSSCPTSIPMIRAAPAASTFFDTSCRRRGSAICPITPTAWASLTSGSSVWQVSICCLRLASRYEVVARFRLCVCCPNISRFTAALLRPIDLCRQHEDDVKPGYQRRSQSRSGGRLRVLGRMLCAHQTACLNATFLDSRIGGHRTKRVAPHGFPTEVGAPSPYQPPKKLEKGSL